MSNVYEGPSNTFNIDSQIHSNAVQKSTSQFTQSRIDTLSKTGSAKNLRKTGSSIKKRINPNNSTQKNQTPGVL